MFRELLPHSSRNFSASATTAMAGFTVFELMITVLIAGLIAAFAIPSLNTTIQNGKQRTFINHINGALQFARAEAAAKNRVIKLCASADGESCSGSNVWETGWIVYEDVDGDDVVDIDNSNPANDERRRVGEDISATHTLRYSGSGTGDQIEYYPDGTTSDGTGNGFTFVLCDERGATQARAINVNRLGRIRTALDTGGTPGVVEGEDGNDVSCP